MDLTAVGTQTSNDQLRAMMQKAADDNAKQLAEAAAPATPTARATNAASTSTAAPQNAGEVTSSAVVATQSEPTSRVITKTYKDGSVEAESAGMATGTSASARINIETMNFGVSIYNSAKRSLEDTTHLDELRKVYGDEKTGAHIAAMKSVMEDGLFLMNHAIGMMRNEFSVTGTVATQENDGSFKAGQYTQAASGSGWSVSVKSTGEAKAIANGIDVSDQVSDHSSAGFDWREVIAKHQAESATAEEPRGSNNIDAVLKLLEQARTSLDGFVERARKALADYAPSQNNASTKAPVQGVDVAA